MTVADLQLQFDYGKWANRRLLEVISTLAPELFTQTVGGSYGSLRNTMVHAMSAEAGWLGRCGGPARGPKLNPDDYPTVVAVERAWEAIDAKVRAFLETLRDQDLDRILEYGVDAGPTRAMPIGDMLQHAANHSVHHRGQVSLLLRMLGHAPAPVDLLLFLGERRGLQPW